MQPDSFPSGEVEGKCYNEVAFTYQDPHFLGELIQICTRFMLKIYAAIRCLLAIPGLIMIGIVRFYQFAISPMLGPNCRFHPTCSQYFIEAVKKYGVIRGALKGIWRIVRCNPWNPGGYDPP
jgi:uncharacterized protein